MALWSTYEALYSRKATLGTIAKIKPKLEDLSQGLDRKLLLNDLQHLAALGETLTEQRQRFKIPPDHADVLDREGQT